MGFRGFRMPDHTEAVDIDLRPVGEGDLAGLLAVYRECEDFLALGPTAKASPEMVRGDLEASAREGGVFCGVYLRGSGLIGVADFVPGNFRGDRETAYIALLMLKASFRNRGIGAQAVERIESEICRDPGIRRIRAGVMVNNPKAIRFWRRRGFAIVSGPERLADRTTVYRIEKSLAASG
jgi:RimJ/RimL family protein N-acetyltransferase